MGAAPERATRLRAAPSGRFPKQQRVRKRREFLEIQALGRRVSLEHFVLVLNARPQSEGSQARLGITASRKVGGAVQRSRARRVLREAFRANRELFPPDIDVVVIVKRLPAGFGLKSVSAEWQRAAGLVKRRVDEARRALDAKPKLG